MSSTAGLVRPRLLDELAGLRTRRLALVVAPAGAGKTTLLAHFAAGWDGPVGWWRVDPAGSTADLVAACLWRIVPGLPDLPPPADPEALVAALRGLDRPDTLVVIDDLHRLADPAAESAVERMVVDGPGWLHVLAGGRRMPGFTLSRYELSDVRVIDGEHLRFRSWETEYLLRDVYGEPLPPDDVAALSRRVGGWAAGLHMFHLSTHNRPLRERRRAVAALDGRQALTRAYLARTVLAELPAALREFLVRTCVFDVLTATRCERLLDGPGTSDRFLGELEQRQAFTASTDGGQRYHYHEVLRAHLAVMLAEQLGDAGARAWHARAAALLADEGAHIEAARAYARAEDWDQVRRLLHKDGTHLADGGVDPWQDHLPEWLIAEDPWLMLATARQLFARGQLGRATESLRAAEDHFFDEQGRARCRTMRHLVAVWSPTAAAVPGHYSTALREATRRHPGQVAAAADHPLVRTVGHLLAGDVAAARHALPADDPAGTGVSDLGVRVLRVCFDLADRWPTARRVLARLLADAEWAGQPWLVRLARAAAALDGSSLGLAEARAVVRECDSDQDRWGATLAHAAVCLARSAPDCAEGSDPEEARELVRRCGQLDAAVLVAWAEALFALATAAAGRPQAAEQARRGERLARAAGVPGARVLALSAAARCGDGRADTRTLGVHCGLPNRLLAHWAGALDPAGTHLVEVAPVEVWCFGGFQLRRHGQPVDLSTVKPRTRIALRLLAMHAGRPVHRETMLEALWPGVPVASATRSLHVTLSNLRASLQPDGQRGLICRNGDAYELSLPTGGYSDVAAFHTALHAARRARLAGDEAVRVESLRAAVFAYGGELLPEDGPAEWVVHEREMLRRQAADAAGELATATLAAGELTDAVAAAERCVQIDRYCDAGWRLLVEGYQLLGNHAAAARARREYAHLLASLDTAATAAPLQPST